MKAPERQKQPFTGKENLILSLTGKVSTHIWEFQTVLVHQGFYHMEVNVERKFCHNQVTHSVPQTSLLCQPIAMIYWGSLNTTQNSTRLAGIHPAPLPSKELKCCVFQLFFTGGMLHLCNPPLGSLQYIHVKCYNKHSHLLKVHTILPPPFNIQ